MQPREALLVIAQVMEMQIHGEKIAFCLGQLNKEVDKYMAKEHGLTILNWKAELSQGRNTTQGLKGHNTEFEFFLKILECYGESQCGNGNIYLAVLEVCCAEDTSSELKKVFGNLNVEFRSKARLDKSN